MITIKMTISRKQEKYQIVLWVKLIESQYTYIALNCIMESNAEILSDKLIVLILGDACKIMNKNILYEKYIFNKFPKKWKCQLKFINYSRIPISWTSWWLKPKVPLDLLHLVKALLAMFPQFLELPIPQINFGYRWRFRKLWLHIESVIIFFIVNNNFIIFLSCFV